MAMKVKLIFAWYDIWIGAFYDKKKNWIYIFPLPMLGIILKLPEKWRISYVVRMWRLPNYGKCKDCKTERATHDWNGHEHYLCDSCGESADRYFEDEYR